MNEADIALADAFMSIFGYRRTAIKQDNVVWPAAFGPHDEREDER
ncbi:MAG TPA: hypothetical protein PKX87_05235 [Alphaproteobacteria bacterium]|nr:hypothetical protein [Alphaproteobacteria bacterium]